MRYELAVKDLVADDAVDLRELRHRELLNHCAELTQQLAAARSQVGSLPDQLLAARAAKELWHDRWCVAMGVITVLIPVVLILAWKVLFA